MDLSQESNRQDEGPEEWKDRWEEGMQQELSQVYITRVKLKQRNKMHYQVLTETSESENQLLTQANHKNLQNRITKVIVNRSLIFREWKPVL